MTAPEQNILPKASELRQAKETATQNLYRQLAREFLGLDQGRKLIALGWPSAADLDLQVEYAGSAAEKNLFAQELEDHLQRTVDANATTLEAQFGWKPELDVFILTSEEMVLHTSKKYFMKPSTVQRLASFMDKLTYLGIETAPLDDEGQPTAWTFQHNTMMGAFLAPRQVLLFDRDKPQEGEVAFVYPKEALPPIAIGKEDIFSWLLIHANKAEAELQHLTTTLSSLEPLMKKFLFYERRLTDYPPEIQDRYEQLRHCLNRLAKIKIRYAVGETFLNYLELHSEHTTIPQGLINRWMVSIREAEERGFVVDAEVIKWMLSEPELATCLPEASYLVAEQSPSPSSQQQIKQKRIAWWLVQLLRSELTAEHLHHYSLEDMHQFSQDTKQYTQNVIERLIHRLSELQ